MVDQSPKQVSFDILEKLLFFSQEKARYKVAYGGRGSGKSWGIATSLILLCLQNKLKILCTRELQNSINDSVHSLLKGAIERAGVSDMFEITLTSIRSTNGSEFLFKGLRNNISEIKSLEGIDICWVEEAQGITKEAWDTLIPTIRKQGAEIWVSFNPNELIDETYQRFVVQPRTNSIVREVNYVDNKFFKETSLWQDMEDDRLMSPEKYNNVWLGIPKTRSDAQVFKDKWESYPFETPPTSEMYQGRLFQGADWGFNPDPLTGVQCFIKDNVLFIPEEVFATNVELNMIGHHLNKLPNFKKNKTYGDSARPDIISMLRKEGFNIQSVKKTTVSADPLNRQKADSYVQSGIDYLKNFRKIVIHPRCKNLIAEFTNYKHKVDRNTGEILPEIIDKWNHGIDAIRYSLADYIRFRVSLADIARARHQESQPQMQLATSKT